jgi:CrcB protein
MEKLIAIFLGGGIGSSARWLTGLFFDKFTKGEFPYSTLFVNIVGSFVLGFLSYYLMEKLNVAEEWRLFLTIGFCGGFTTFSTFAFEHFNMLQGGEVVKSVIYMFLSLVLGIIAIVSGVLFARLFN